MLAALDLTQIDSHSK